MKNYIKHNADSDLGVGMAYMEFTDGWATRQVEVYGQNWRWGDVKHNLWLADQPYERLELGPEHEIAPEEFEAMWKEALKQCPPPS